MAIFGKKAEPEPAAPEPTAAPTTNPDTNTEPGTEPAPDTTTQSLAQMQEAIANLAETVQTGLTHQPAPTPAAPEPLPPIQDISDEDLSTALEEGGDIARRAMAKRSAADQERIRREFQGQITQLQTTGVGAINQLTVKTTLQDKPYYKNDPQIRKEVDAQLSQLTGDAMLDARAIDYVYNQVVGLHSERLLAEAKEEAMRQAREPEPTPVPTRKDGLPGTPGNEDNVPTPQDLTKDAQGLLQSRNNGRGQTPDEFARSMPPRRVKDPESGRTVRKTYESWDDMMQTNQQAQEEYAQQLDEYYGE